MADKRSILFDESNVYHRSRSLTYRDPFGAVSTGRYVRLSIDVHAPVREVRLCSAYGLYSFAYGELRMDEEEETPGRYSVRVRMPGEACLFFYWFSLTPADSDAKGVTPPSKVFYVLSRHHADGTGRISDTPSRIGAHEDRYPAAFQITVYDASFTTPDWFKGAVMYQIFPDRFRRGSSFSFEAMTKARPAPERIYHKEWAEEVDIHGTTETGYLACDFFGGDLEGVAESRPYLEALHIDCLYLNPIFEARSNHRYDTADYTSTDPVLGGERAFSTFSNSMQKAGIRYLLDGVFSHTGADSRYFNRLGRYAEPGAYQEAADGKKSRFSSWYSIRKSAEGKIEYDSWWGFSDLPNVNENDLSYREYLFGENGVIPTWLLKGASGFRLDVSDELPDAFLREMRASVKSFTSGDGVVLGEVWEDASNKISYGSYRDFLLGRTHDSVMGYTFRDAVLGFLSNALDAQNLNARLESFRENYPPEAYYCIMNLISSHDVPRAITVMSGNPDPGSRELQKDLTLTPDQQRIGMSKMRLALILQMGYVGNPCIYYGDEVAMEGYRDPFNRRTYPWDATSLAQRELLAFFRNVTGLRRQYPVLKTGMYRTRFSSGDVFLFERYLDSEGKDLFGREVQGVRHVLFAVNRNELTSACFSLTLVNEEIQVTPEPAAKFPEARDEEVQSFGVTCQITIEPLSYRVIAFEEDDARRGFVWKT